MVVGIELAVWDVPLVAAWADALIANCAEAPPSWLIECSLAQNSTDALQALASAAAGSSLLHDADLALALVARRLSLGAVTAREATRSAFSLVVRGGGARALAGTVYSLDDGFDLAEAGIVGTGEQMDRQAVEFFEGPVQETASATRLRSFLAAGGRLLQSDRGRRAES